MKKLKKVDPAPPNSGLTYFMWIPGHNGPTTIKISKDMVQPPVLLRSRVVMTEDEKKMRLSALAALYPCEAK